MSLLHHTVCLCTQFSLSAATLTARVITTLTDKLIVHVAYSQLYAAVAYLPLRKMATVINVYVRELGEVGGGGGKGKVCVLS